MLDLKFCICGVGHLYPNICEDYLAHETLKYHKLSFLTERIFSNNQKASGEIPLAFCGGNQGDATFRGGLQKTTVIPTAVYKVTLNYKPFKMARSWIWPV